ncbi:29385_t:CDS:2 [Gigaspora margarita]|uniref:29385_t:CDS:1 n=1 Tax=Gigaspora margarita TaxID=4874 RepID=A0ABN7V602_GIGMA|nr:29385_t:CDS:2 [Gigaspora margarita]
MSEKVKAAVIPAKGAKLEIQLVDKPVPKPYVYDESSGEKGELLIKIKAIALNPIDCYQVIDGLMVDGYPAVLGCDVAGIVEAVGEGVTDFSPGEEICGVSKMGFPGHYGAFAEYTLLDASTTYKKPPHITFEEAATIPVGSLTAGLALFDSLNLPPPSGGPQWFKEEFILIWGGASSVGSNAIQLAVNIGLTVITTASPKNHEYLRELGAAYTFDYNAPDVVDQIKKASQGRLKYAFDTIGSKTASLGAQALGTNGKIACISFEPVETREDVEVTRVALATVYRRPKDYLKVTNRILKEVEALLLERRLRPSNVTTLPGGLDGLPSALEKMKKGVSATKLVIVVE